MFLGAWGNLPPAPSAHRPVPLTGLQSSEAGGLSDGESGVWNGPGVDLGFKRELGRVALSRLTDKWGSTASLWGDKEAAQSPCVPLADGVGPVGPVGTVGTGMAGAETDPVAAE